MDLTLTNGIIFWVTFTHCWRLVFAIIFLLELELVRMGTSLYYRAVGIRYVYTRGWKKFHIIECNDLVCDTGGVVMRV